MSGNMILAMILMPVSLLFTGLGIFAIRRKEPMWFWSGSTVDRKEISDVKAYNRANGIMWIVFSCVFWIGTVLGLLNMKAAGIVVLAGGIIGVILLPVCYTKIYDRYRA